MPPFAGARQEPGKIGTGVIEACKIEAMAALFPAVPVEVECAVCQNWGEKK